MAIVDINALSNIGNTMGGKQRDNTVRDQAISLLGGGALQLLSGALNTRRALKAESNSTLANAQYDVSQLGAVGSGPNNIDAAYSTEILNEQRKIIRKANNAISIGINTGKATAKKVKAEQAVKNHVEGLKYVDNMMTTWKGIYKDGTVEVPDGKGKGGTIKRKVKVNAGSNATSQSLGAAFADGSIASSLEFRDGQWGIVGESIIPGANGCLLYTSPSPRD